MERIRKWRAVSAAVGGEAGQVRIGARSPAKIERFTLMCPIHGNL